MAFSKLREIQVYAHRGQSSSKYAENSYEAITESKDLNFGVEIDVRFRNNKLCLSHDIVSENSVTELYRISELRIPTAINLKEDGLLNQIMTIVDFSNTNNSFIFDGSIPEMYQAARLKIPHALRLSEFERDLPWNSDYIWLDSFESDWWLSNADIVKVISENKVVIVSPELHGRDFEKSWNRIREISIESNSWIGVCTDFPKLFQDFWEQEND